MSIHNLIYSILSLFYFSILHFSKLLEIILMFHSFNECIFFLLFIGTPNAWY